MCWAPSLTSSIITLRTKPLAYVPLGDKLHSYHSINQVILLKCKLDHSAAQNPQWPPSHWRKAQVLQTSARFRAPTTVFLLLCSSFTPGSCWRSCTWNASGTASTGMYATAVPSSGGLSSQISAQPTLFLSSGLCSIICFQWFLAWPVYLTITTILPHPLPSPHTLGAPYPSKDDFSPDHLPSMYLLYVSLFNLDWCSLIPQERKLHEKKSLSVLMIALLLGTLNDAGTTVVWWIFAGWMNTACTLSNFSVEWVDCGPPWPWQLPTLKISTKTLHGFCEGAMFHENRAF